MAKYKITAKKGSKEIFSIEYSSKTKAEKFLPRFSRFLKSRSDSVKVSAV